MAKIYFYALGESFFRSLDRHKALLQDVYAFIDSDPQKQNQVVFGKRVYSPDVLAGDRDFDRIVVTSETYFAQIRERLMADYGVPAGAISFLDDYIAEKIIRCEIPPTHLGIDASTRCQLNCTACYMRLGNSGVLGAGSLRFEDFRRLIDANPSVRHIELSNNGEIFLNPELKAIMEYAYLKDVALYAYNGVNLNHAPEDVLDALVRCGFRAMSVSLDGACQETYVQYRRNGNFDTVIENIRKINRLKYRYHSEYPHLIWQFVVMNHNEKDVREAKYLANELNMEIRFKATWEDGFRPDNPLMLKAETGNDFLPKGVDHNDTAIFGNTLCKQLFLAPRINWDGRLIGCCVLWDKDFGVNVFETGLTEALTSPVVMAAKRMLMGGDGGDEADKVPCLHCPYYKAMKQNGCFLKSRDLLKVPKNW